VIEMKYLIGYTYYIQIAWVIVFIFSSLMKFFLPSKYTKDIDEFQFNGGIVIALIFLLALIASLIWKVIK